jgi:hypothetical protein
VVCEVLGECICLGITAGSFPIGAKILSPVLYHLPYVVNVLTGSLLEVVLSFTDVVLVADFAMEVVNYHTLPAVVVVEASSVS